MKEENRNKTENTENNGRNPDGTFAKGNNFGSHDNRRYSIVEQFKKRLSELPKGAKKELREIWVDKWIQKAIIEGDWHALREGIRYIDGMPKQTIENEGNIDINITRKIID